MKVGSKASVHVAVILAVSALVVGGLALGTLVVLSHIAFADAYEEFKPLEEGMTASQVIDLLGQPDQIYDSAVTGDYYVEGYSHPRRAISGRVGGS
jgi:outer membrane protein assembly factor BamE (lipoprotein component of BamABCDE complex)